MLERHRPSAPLDVAVDCIWFSRRDESSPEREHMLPTGNVNLIITLHDSPIEWAHGNGSTPSGSWTRGVVHGPQRRYYLVGPKPKGAVVGVSFRPGMAAALLGVSMNELRDSHPSLDELWGYRGLELHERLASAADARGALRMLEDELLARIRRPLLLHPAVAHALRRSSSGTQRIDEIEQQTGYSPRHFIHLFRSTVGLAPKQYFRIRRFSNALARLAAGDAKLAEVALSAGYADQAHLTREFRELAGVTPSLYRPRSPDSAHHHVVGKESSRR